MVEQNRNSVSEKHLLTVFPALPALPLWGEREGGHGGMLEDTQVPCVTPERCRHQKQQSASKQYLIEKILFWSTAAALEGFKGDGELVL